MPGLEIKRRGEVWWAYGTVAGRRIRESLGTRDRAQAEEAKARLEARCWKRAAYGEEAVRTFDEAAEHYMTQGGERRFLLPILRYFKGRELRTITPGEVRAMARSIYPNAQPATWNRQAVVPARAVILHAHSLGWCAPLKVELFPTRKPKRVAVDRQWIDAFMAQARIDKLPHLAVCVLFMHQTGTRVGEAIRLLPEQVDLGKRVVVLERTKTDEWEVRSLSAELIIALAELDMRPGEPVFGYATRMGVAHRMAAVCRRAGIPYVPPHQAGRHSFATNALALGATVKQAMEAGGWKSARLFLETYAKAEGAGPAVASLFDRETGPIGTNAAQSESAKRKA